MTDDDLLTWLRAQLDERERTARAAMDPDSDWWWDSPESPAEEHIREHRPTYVLADLDAKRRILDEAQQNLPDSTVTWLARQLALPLADRPGYRDEWRPA